MVAAAGSQVVGLCADLVVSRGGETVSILPLGRERSRVCALAFGQPPRRLYPLLAAASKIDSSKAWTLPRSRVLPLKPFRIKQLPLSLVREVP